MKQKMPIYTTRELVAIVRRSVCKTISNVARNGRYARFNAGNTRRMRRTRRKDSWDNNNHTVANEDLD